ncbi:MAG: rod-binding protein [Proteobacteria bacterium]|nr:rod-binding protein [Pseudomonadota bacterium]
MDSPVLLALQQAQNKAPVVPAGRDKAREAAEQFEAVFLAQILDTMFEGVSTEPPFGGGAGEGIFRSLMNAEIADDIAKSGGVGIADSIYRELLRLQEVAA